MTTTYAGKDAALFNMPKSDSTRVNFEEWRNLRFRTPEPLPPANPTDAYDEEDLLPLPRPGEVTIPPLQKMGTQKPAKTSSPSKRKRASPTKGAPALNSPRTPSPTKTPARKMPESRKRKEKKNVTSSFAVTPSPKKMDEPPYPKTRSWMQTGNASAGKSSSHAVAPMSTASTIATPSPVKAAHGLLTKMTLSPTKPSSALQASPTKTSTKVLLPADRVTPTKAKRPVRKKFMEDPNQMKIDHAFTAMKVQNDKGKLKLTAEETRWLYGTAPPMNADNRMEPSDSLVDDADDDSIFDVDAGGAGNEGDNIHTPDDGDGHHDDDETEATNDDERTRSESGEEESYSDDEAHYAPKRRRTQGKGKEAEQDINSARTRPPRVRSSKRPILADMDSEDTDLYASHSVRNEPDASNQPEAHHAIKDSSTVPTTMGKEGRHSLSVLGLASTSREVRDQRGENNAGEQAESDVGDLSDDETVGPSLWWFDGQRVW